MPMNTITKTKVNALMGLFTESLSHLYDRWQDEKMYEDWNDYIKVIKANFYEYCKKALMTNAVFVKGSKRPFGFTFDFESWRVVMSVSYKSLGWKAKKL